MLVNTSMTFEGGKDVKGNKKRGNLYKKEERYRKSLGRKDQKYGQKECFSSNKYLRNVVGGKISVSREGVCLTVQVTQTKAQLEASSPSHQYNSLDIYYQIFAYRGRGKI